MLWMIGAMSEAPATEVRLVVQAPIFYTHAWVDGRPVGPVLGKKQPTLVQLDPGTHEVWYAEGASGIKTLCHGLIQVGETPMEVPVSFSMMEGVTCPGLSPGLPEAGTAFRGMLVNLRSDLELGVQVDTERQRFSGEELTLNLSHAPHTVIVYQGDGSRVLDQFLLETEPGQQLDITCTYKGCIGQSSRGRPIAGWSDTLTLGDGTAEPMPTGAAALATTGGGGAPLMAMAKLSEGGLWGYIDPTGAFAIPPQYERCEPFTPDGLASIKVDDAYAFIGPNGERLATRVGNFSLMSVLGFGVVGFEEGLVPVDVGGLGFMDTKGELVIPARYSWVSSFDDGLAAARGPDGFVVLDPKGNETPVVAGDLVELRRFSEGMAPFRTKKKRFGFIDRSGRVAIEPRFRQVGHFSEGVAWARNDDKRVGYIDPAGNWVVQPIYQAAEPHSDGLGRVRNAEGAWLFVTTDGKEVLPPRVDALKDFTDGLARARSGSRWGLIDTSMQWVVQPRFERLRPFQNGYASAMVGEQWGVIDARGEWVVQPSFEQIKDFWPTGLEASGSTAEPANAEETAAEEPTE